MAFSHGGNDAQKTMGVITLALASYHGWSGDEWDVPLWVILSAAAAMGLGTAMGGWRIVKTMGLKVVELRHDRRVRRRDRGRDGHRDRQPPRHPGLDDPRDLVGDPGRRRDQARLRGALGRGGPDPDRLGRDDSGLRHLGLALLRGAGPPPRALVVRDLARASRSADAGGADGRIATRRWQRDGSVRTRRHLRAAWRPEEITRRLAGVAAPWYVAAGWSIDLFLGRETREHEDLEIGVPHERFDEVAAALPEMEMFVIGDGTAWPLATAGAAFEKEHQTWTPGTRFWTVAARHLPRAVRRRSVGVQAGRAHPAAIRPGDPAHRARAFPFSRPEITLLFKAKASRPKDDADFANVLPAPGSESRRWLADALRIVAPGSPPGSASLT